MENDPRTLVTAVVKEAGVSDLTPLKVKGFFAKAIVAERLGNYAEAQVQLDKAVGEEINAAS